MPKRVFIFSLFLVFLVNISFLKLVLNPTYSGWIINFVYLISIPLLLFSAYNKANQLDLLYILLMFVGLIFHALLPHDAEFIRDSAQWAFLVILLVASRKYETPRSVFFVLLAFFICNCVIAIIEYRLQANLFDYRFVEGFSNFSDRMEFRAFGLMEHPLQAANVTLIIMSFIMTCKAIKKGPKLFLLTLGAVGIICFNSRIAMIICACLLLYYYVLYNVKPVLIVVLGLIVYTLFLSDILFFIQQNASIFGRLAEKNSLTDDSSLTRWMSYLFFWNAGWSLQDIILGGRIIYMPGTEASLENGILLTIAWWGWIIGPLKVVLELTISYLCLKNYNAKDKWIVMIACWGTAFSNNNSMSTFVFVFFIFAFLAIKSLEQKKIRIKRASFPIYPVGCDKR